MVMAEKSDTSADHIQGEWEWPRTTLGRQISALETSLMCPICGQLFNVPAVVTLCGHVFCSECVQRSLEFKPECPSCRIKVATSDVKAVRAISDICTAFTDARSSLLALTKQPIQPSFDTEKECIAAKSNYEAASHSYKRLPKLHYQSISDKQIKQYLAKLHLPLHGDREILVWRHREYTRLHNAQCDATLPLTTAEMTGEVASRERARRKDKQDAKKAAAIFASAETSDALLHKRKGFAEQFSYLIEQLKDRKRARVQTSGDENTSDKSETACASSVGPDCTVPDSCGDEKHSEDEQQAFNGSCSEEASDGVWGEWRVVLGTRPLFVRTSTGEVQTDPPKCLLVERTAALDHAVAHLEAQLKNDPKEIENGVFYRSSRSECSPVRSGECENRRDEDDVVEILPSTWTCPRCTYQNPTTARRCEICDGQPISSAKKWNPLKPLVFDKKNPRRRSGKAPRVPNKAKN